MQQQSIQNWTYFKGKKKSISIYKHRTKNHQKYQDTSWSHMRPTGSDRHRYYGCRLRSMAHNYILPCAVDHGIGGFQHWNLFGSHASIIWTLTRPANRGSYSSNVSVSWPAVSLQLFGKYAWFTANHTTGMTIMAIVIGNWMGLRQCLVHYSP